MRWDEEDIEKYLTDREYVDTSILVIQEIDFNHAKEQVKKTEWLGRTVDEIERKLMGRVLLLPTVPDYHQQTSFRDISERFVSLFTKHFKYQIYLTLNQISSEDFTVKKKDNTLMIRLVYEKSTIDQIVEEIIRLWRE